jgi:hypothetical protein
VGGFETILKRMTTGNFNWLMHVMLFMHTLYVIQKQRERGKKESGSGMESEMDDE